MIIESGGIIYEAERRINQITITGLLHSLVMEAGIYQGMSQLSLSRHIGSAGTWSCLEPVTVAAAYQFTEQR